MKRTALLLLFLAILSPLSILAQCATPNDDFTTYGAGGLVIGAPIYSNDANIGTGIWAGSFMEVSKIVSGRTYSVTTSVNGDLVQVYDGTTQLASGTVGSGAISFTATNSNNVKIYICGNDMSSSRAVRMACTSCSSAPASPPAGNDNCANYVTTTISSNYTPNTPSFTANTTAGTIQTLGICGGSSLGGDDIWYSLTTNGSTFYLRHDNIISTTTLAGNSPSKLLGIAMYLTSCPAANATPQYSCQLTTTGSAVKTITLAAGTYRVRLWANTVNSNLATNVWLYYNPVIPVEMQSFTATTKGNTNTLNWLTATEKDIAHFRVERSDNGTSNWQALAEVKAKGNSTTTQTYDFTDNTPLSISYYRIVSVENSGTTETSKVVSVRREDGKKGIVRIYPQPASEAATIDYASDKNTSINLILMDITGRVILQQNANTTEGSNQIRLNTEGVAKGYYLLKIGSETTKFIKQ